MDVVRLCPNCGNELAPVARYCSRNCALMVRVDSRGDGCWEWQDGLDPHGYGQMGHGGTGKPLKCHRVALEESLGRELSPDECALHTCDNRKCCRVGPGHIRLGTRSENMVECHVKGRGSRPPLPSQMLTVEQHAEIARRRSAGERAMSIARDLGIARHTVYQSRRRVRATHGVARRHWKVEDVLQMVEPLFEQGRTRAAAAAEVGCAWRLADRAFAILGARRAA